MQKCQYDKLPSFLKFFHARTKCDLYFYDCSHIDCCLVPLHWNGDLYKIKENCQKHTSIQQLVLMLLLCFISIFSGIPCRLSDLNLNTRHVVSLKLLLPTGSWCLGPNISTLFWFCYFKNVFDYSIMWYVFERMFISSEMLK